MEKPKEQIERPYFVKQQVEIVKEIHDFITASPEQHYTMEELSEQFDIPAGAGWHGCTGLYTGQPAGKCQHGLSECLFVPGHFRKELVKNCLHSQVSIPILLQLGKRPSDGK